MEVSGGHSELMVALAVTNDGVGALAAVDLGGCDRGELALGVIDTQRLIDRLRSIQARFVAEAGSAGVWVGTGSRDMTAWLIGNGKLSWGDANRLVQLGETLNSSKALSDAVDDGTISTATAEALQPAIASSARSGTDVQDLVDACAGATPAQARQAGAFWQEKNRPTDETEQQREHTKRQQRRLRFADNGDGMTRIDGLLPTLDSRIVQDAPTAIIPTPADGDDRTCDQRNADALVLLADAYSKGTVTGGRERPTVLVTIDIDVLQGRTPGAGYTATGEVIPAQVVRHMCDNANLVRVLTSNSVPLDLGRAQRLASTDQYRALMVRDGGCRMPDCTIPAAWCEIDHIREWEADTGPTDVDFLVLWCVYHHHFRHRPDVTLHGDANNLSITLPDGRTIPLPARGPTIHKAA